MPGVLKTIQLDGRGDGHFISGDCDPNISNEHITLKANAGNLPAGQVLGKLTVGGQYAAHDPDAEDGTEDAVAILWGARENRATAQRASATFRHAVANGNALTMKTGISNNDRDAAIAALAAQHLMVRF